MDDDGATARLGIPKFPADLKRRLKVRAAKEATTLRDVTVRAAKEYLERSEERAGEAGHAV